MTEIFRISNDNRKKNELRKSKQLTTSDSNPFFSPGILLCYIMLCHVMLCYVLLCCVMLYNIIVIDDELINYILDQNDLKKKKNENGNNDNKNNNNKSDLKAEEEDLFQFLESVGWSTKKKKKETIKNCL